MSNTNLEFKWLGTTDYLSSLSQQDEIFKNVKRGSPGVILGLEHPPVVTLGRRGQKDLDVSSALPASWQVLSVDRGGQATLHNPGQLVIYPVVSLTLAGWTPNSWVHFLQDVTQNMLLNLGIHTQPCEGAGLMTDFGKLVFMGLRIREGISTHGLALNVCNELSDFKFIRSCGQADAKVDGLRFREVPWGPEKVFELWSLEFRKALKALASPQLLC